MAGIALVLDLLKKNSNFYTTQFSASVAAASATAVTTTPFASRFIFGSPKLPVAYCDAGIALPGNYISNRQKVAGNLLERDSLRYTTKEYHIELKPLFSAFEWKQLAMTSLRSFLMFYLPLLEPSMNLEEDDEDFLQDTQEGQHVDLVVPFQKSVKQIVRETTVVTTRRVLERLAVHYMSQRMAWKLLKGHFLGVAASWLIQVGIEIYRFLSRLAMSEEETIRVDKSQEVQVLGKKVHGVTIRCGASLVFASIGAGIGAALIRPSMGQWIGCAVGDLAGPIIVSVCLEKYLHVDL